MKDDTIAAIATPRGTGGVAVIRISGASAPMIADKLFKSKTPPSEAQPYLMQYGSIREGGSLLDKGMCVMMRAPHSFTGEDVAEFHIHGGLRLADRILEAVLDAGARLALPGEFTRRAFLNGKIDLARAEAIGDLIHANADIAATAAVNQLEGRLSEKIRKIRDNIIELTAKLSVAADYPEEDISYLSDADFSDALDSLSAELGHLIHSARAGCMIREGVRCAIVGRPNTGKSSLLNAIVGKYRAIVTDVAGTTRDIVEEAVSIGGIPVLFGDTAGLREGEGEAEKAGIRMARNYIKEADFCLFVLDTATPTEADAEILQIIGDTPYLTVCNKNDLHDYPDGAVSVSALTGNGMEKLSEAILTLLTDILSGDDLRAADRIRLTNTRQRDAAVKAKEAVDFARKTLADGFPPDLTAVDLENAAAALGEIIGLSVSDEVISRIFEKFCLGK